MSTLQTGFPDWQRITQWFGSALDSATAFPIGAGAKVVGPLDVSNFASIVVCVKPTGGNVTVTVDQQVPAGPASLKVSSSFVVTAGNVIFEAFVLLAGAATVTFEGSAGGETLDYAIVPSNTNTNAEVAALTQLGFQHNDAVVANETAIDLEDAAPIGWTFVDDPAGLRMKITPTLRQNGAALNSVYRWTGSAWVPTANVLLDDTNKSIALGSDLALVRSAAALGSLTDNAGNYAKLRLGILALARGADTSVAGSVIVTLSSFVRVTASDGSNVNTFNGLNADGSILCLVNASGALLTFVGTNNLQAGSTLANGAVSLWIYDTAISKWWRLV